VKNKPQEKKKSKQATPKLGSRPLDSMEESSNKFTSRSYNSKLGEPKFIFIKRKDNILFGKISIFIIKKSVDYACGGEIESLKY